MTDTLGNEVTNTIQPTNDIHIVRSNIMKYAFNFDGKMAYALQRKIWGAVKWGKRTIKIDCFNWRITEYEIVDFGRDCNMKIHDVC
jgi:hypothetical protein